MLLEDAIKKVQLLIDEMGHTLDPKYIQALSIVLYEVQKVPNKNTKPDQILYRESFPLLTDGPLPLTKGPYKSGNYNFHCNGKAEEPST